MLGVQGTLNCNRISGHWLVKVGEGCHAGDLGLSQLVDDPSICGPQQESRKALMTAAAGAAGCCGSSGGSGRPAAAAAGQEGRTAGGAQPHQGAGGGPGARGGAARGAVPRRAAACSQGGELGGRVRMGWTHCQTSIHLVASACVASVGGCRVNMPADNPPHSRHTAACNADAESTCTLTGRCGARRSACRGGPCRPSLNASREPAWRKPTLPPWRTSIPRCKP